MFPVLPLARQKHAGLVMVNAVSARDTSNAGMHWHGPGGGTAAESVGEQSNKGWAKADNRRVE